MASPKETKFFSDESKYKRGVEFYRTLFPCSDSSKLNGEFSPGYLHHHQTAGRIKEQYPDVKIIACLRNPITRAHSHFLKHTLKGKNVTKTFSEAIREPHSPYVRISLYAHHLQEYLSCFGKSQMLILIYEDMGSDPRTFMQTIYSFLGVDPTFTPPSLYRKVNFLGYGKARLPTLNRGIYALEHAFINQQPWASISPVLKTIGVHKMKEITKSLNTKGDLNAMPVVSQMDAEDRKYLYAIYRDDIQQLEKMLDRDLSFWK